MTIQAYINRIQAGRIYDPDSLQDMHSLDKAKLAMSALGIRPTDGILAEPTDTSTIPASTFKHRLLDQGKDALADALVEIAKAPGKAKAIIKGLNGNQPIHIVD